MDMDMDMDMADPLAKSTVDRMLQHLQHTQVLTQVLANRSQPVKQRLLPPVCVTTSTKGSEAQDQQQRIIPCQGPREVAVMAVMAVGMEVRVSVQDRRRRRRCQRDR